MSLDKAAIFAANDRKIEKVNVPEWGGDVYVRVMGGKDKDRFDTTFVSANGKANLANIRARLAVLTVCDANGQYLFDEGDAERLGDKSAVALDRIFEVARRLNGIGDSEIEDVAKNSGGDRQDERGTD